MKERSILMTRKVLLVASAGGLAFGMYMFDKGPKSIDAADNTPSATPVPIAPLSPTPTIPGIWLTVTAEAGKLQQDQDRARAEATLKAIATEREILKRPATETSIPVATNTPFSPAAATATSEAIRLEILAKRQAEIKATATAEANLTATAEAKQTATVDAKTATAESRLTVTSTRQDGSSDEGGGFPWGCVVGLLTIGGCIGATALAAGAGVGYAATREGRGQIQNGINFIRIGIDFGTIAYQHIRDFLRRFRGGGVTPPGGGPPTP